MALSDDKLELIDEALSTDRVKADSSLYLNYKKLDLTIEQAEAIVATIYNDEISLDALQVLINDVKGLDDELVQSNPWGGPDFTEEQSSWLEQQGFNFEVVYQKK